MVVLLPIGKGVEAAGSLVNISLDLTEGKKGKVAVNIASSLLFGKATTKVQKLEQAGKLARNESTLLQFIIDVHNKITNTFTNLISDN